MTDFPTATDSDRFPPAPVLAPPAAVPEAAEPTAPAGPAPDAPQPVERGARSGPARRHGRGRGRRLSPSAAAPAAPDAATPGARTGRPVPPVLEQLAELYPGLFGAVFLPLKRGIFEDLMQAHPDGLDREALKAGLAIHTRSTRYLQSVAAGLQRHDLNGKAVEAMAPEHVYHALTEVFRRRQARGGEDLRPKLIRRLVQAFEASGLSREDYEARVRGRDEAANILLDEALAEAASRRAKDEALLRAFENAGQSVEGFAGLYGLDPQAAAQTLARARQRRGLSAE